MLSQVQMEAVTFLHPMQVLHSVPKECALCIGNLGVLNDFWFVGYWLPTTQRKCDDDRASYSMARMENCGRVSEVTLMDMLRQKSETWLAGARKDAGSDPGLVDNGEREG
jgi:hypothetical protein